jgi:hypothetical protein
LTALVQAASAGDNRASRCMGNVWETNKKQHTFPFVFLLTVREVGSTHVRWGKWSFTCGC